MFATTSASAEHLVATEAWRHSTGVPSGPPNARVGDFDGDGRDEIATLVNVEFNEGREGGGVISLFGDTDGSGFRILATNAWEGTFPSSASVAAGDRDLLVAVRRSQSSYPPLTDLAVFSGVPLRLARLLPIEAFVTPTILGGGDLDADGSPDVIISNWNGYEALNLMTGAKLWERETNLQMRRLAVLQLDADPALEIVVSGEGGLVIDGATGTPDWIYPAGFGREVAGGDFDEDPTTLEFVTAGWSSEFAVFFRGAPYSPIFDDEVGMATYSVHSGDFLPAPGDEVALVDRSKVVIVDPSFGVATEWSKTPDDGVGTGRFDGTGASLALFEASGLRIARPDGTTVHLEPRIGAAGAGTLAIGDLDGDGRPEIVHAMHGVENNQIELRVLSEDGVLRESRVLEVPGTRLERFRAFEVALGQMDTDPQMEVLIGGMDYLRTYAKVLAYDGLSFSLQWNTGDALPNLMEPFAGLTVADVDGDGVDEPIVVTEAVRLHLLHPDTGAQVWQSETVQWSNWIDVSMFDTDADGVAEIVMSSGPGLFAFDTATLGEEWSHHVDDPLITQRSFYNIDGQCRFSTLSRRGPINEFDCVSGTARRAFKSTQATDWLQPLPPAASSSQELIALRQGKLVLMDSDFSAIEPLSAYLSPAAGYGGKGVEWLDRDRRSLVIAAGMTVRSVKIRPLKLFDDAFE